MKGHDAMCPTAFPHLKERKNCAYCNLIDVVRGEYKSRHKRGSYEDGFSDGYAAAIKKLQEAVEV